MNARDLKLSQAQWLALLQKYEVPESSLTGKAAPCPICGGNDRFTYDNKHGRGDWVCRKCNNGSPKAADGLELICKVAGITFFELMVELAGGTLAEARTRATHMPIGAAKPKRKADAQWVSAKLNSSWDRALPLSGSDLASRYLQARVPGLSVQPSSALRLGMLDYWYEKKVIGQWPGILARFTLPDGRLGTLHRTFLERSRPAKASIVSADGEILDSKLNDLTLNKLNGGAVRLMDPVNGEIGVAEGLENAYAGYMQFRVPAWYCLNRILLADFVVPEGSGIRAVHIFADFDAVDARTKQSPGMAAALKLAKRLRAEGYTVTIHRPKRRETDFADEWFASRSAVAASASAIRREISDRSALPA